MVQSVLACFLLVLVVRTMCAKVQAIQDPDQATTAALVKQMGLPGGAGPCRRRVWCFRGKEELGTYHMVINTDSLVRIGTEGWDVNIKNQETADRLLAGMYVKVGIVGMYNRGKTFILNSLIGGDLLAGTIHHTKGLSVIAPEEEGIIYMDTAGQNMPVTADEEAFKDRLLSEKFLRDMVMELSDVIIVVINQLTLDDQQYLQVLRKHADKLYSQKETDVKKSFIIIHNFKHIHDEKQIRGLMKKELEDCANTTEVSETEPKMTWWREQKTNFKHLIMVKHNTPLADKWNKPGFEFIKMHLKAQTKTLTEEKLSVPILNSFLRFTRQKLPWYFQAGGIPSEYFVPNSKERLADHALTTCPSDDGQVIKLACTENLEGKIKYKTDLNVYNHDVSVKAKFETRLDYMLYRGEAQSVVVIDVPGLFLTTGDANATAVKMKSNVKRGNKAYFEWKEFNVLVLTVDIQFRYKPNPDDSSTLIAPYLMLQAYQRFEAIEGQSTKLDGTRVPGNSSLRVDLDEVVDTNTPIYVGATANVSRAGVLEIRLEHEVDAPDEDEEPEAKDEF